MFIETTRLRVDCPADRPHDVRVRAVPFDFSVKDVVCMEQDERNPDQTVAFLRGYGEVFLDEPIGSLRAKRSTALRGTLLSHN